MDAKEIKGVECEDCGEFTETDKLVTKYKCDNCGELYDDKESADGCCDDQDEP